MIHRFKQLISALNAHLSVADYTYVGTVLSPQEERLFRAMDIIDQRHCLDVAKTCLELSDQASYPVNQNLLLKGALLHDVGKRQGDLKLWHRVTIVLLQSFCPRVFHRLAEKPGTPYHISKYHPIIGAEFCTLAGCPKELVQLVKLHHSKSCR